MLNKLNNVEMIKQSNINISTPEEINEYNLNKSKLYLDIEKALLNGEEEVIIRDLNIFRDSKEIFKILEEISNDNPEIMYYKGAEYHFGKLKLYYSKSKEDILSHRTEIENKRNELLNNKISPNMSDFEKVLAIHDYIINNARYDERLLLQGVIPPESYSTYGVLNLGIGVCESYAKAMKYLLDGVNIESLIVIGESNGENHAWNLVKLDDEYYHIDPTWNDPVTNNGFDVIRYNFFNLNDEEISKTHTWERDNYPIAKGEKYNYFRYFDLVINKKEELENKIKEGILKKNNLISLKVNDFNLNNYIVRDIIENIAYKNYETIKLKGYSYAFDEEYGIINFEFFYD